MADWTVVYGSTVPLTAIFTQGGVPFTLTPAGEDVSTTCIYAPLGQNPQLLNPRLQVQIVSWGGSNILFRAVDTVSGPLAVGQYSLLFFHVPERGVELYCPEGGDYFDLTVQSAPSVPKEWPRYTRQRREARRNRRRATNEGRS